jgi:hypothetical protein
MNNYESIIGETIHWKVNHLIRPEWTLEYEGATVASLTTDKMRFSPNRKGSFGCVNVDIEYNRKEDQSYFIDRNKDEIFAKLENVFGQARVATKMSTLTKFHFKNLNNYEISYLHSRYAFQNHNGEVLAWTDFNAHGMRTKSDFTLEHIDEKIDPWLIAMVSNYYAIIQASPM